MPTLDYRQLYIGANGAIPPSRQPSMYGRRPPREIIGFGAARQPGDIDAAVAAARAAFDDPDGWATWHPKQRADVLEKFAAELEARGAETAARVSMQNGMPIWLAQQFEAGFPPLLLRYCSDLMNGAPVEERQGMLGGVSLVSRQPIPGWSARSCRGTSRRISFLKIAPALAAGCTVVLKPAEETVLDAFLMAEAAAAAGLPPASSTWSPAAATSVPTWWNTPTSTRCPSPDPPPPGEQSPKPAGGCCGR